MEAGTEFVLYGVATIPGNRLALIADHRVKVAGITGSKSNGLSVIEGRSWPNTVAGEKAALAHAGELNAATAARLRLHESNMATVTP